MHRYIWNQTCASATKIQQAYTITNPSLKPVLPEKRRAFPVFWLYAESTITEMRPTMHLICAVPTKPKRISSQKRQCRKSGICPECGTEYDIGYGTGAPTKGVSQFPLRKYYMTPVSSDRQEWVVKKLKKCVTLHFFYSKYLQKQKFHLPLHSQTKTMQQCGSSSVGRA